MAEFMAITTQEQFNEAIRERLERERAKYSDYETLKEKAAQFDKLQKQDYPGKIAALEAELQAAKETASGAEQRIAEANAKAGAAESGLMKARVAYAHRIPLELSGKLSGETEEELAKDAENFAKFLQPQGAPPLASVEPKSADPFTASLQTLNEQLKGD